VDFVIVNGQSNNSDEYSFTVQAAELRGLMDDKPLALADCHGKIIHAMAGIGNPQRFFNTLQGMGLSFEETIFPDHHAFTAEEIAFPQADIIIMTEKDAVKCKRFADSRHFYLPITVVCQPEFLVNLSHKLRSIK
jgi:tetraacyldisaccharide 4'-kinase